MMNIKRTLLLALILFFASTCTPISHAQLPNVYEQTTTIEAYVHYDFDEDGMYNWWELLYGLDPLDPSDAALDNDSDGLINLIEFQYLTSPIDSDTDDGGVSDGKEVEQCNRPLDPSDDNDGDNCINNEVIKGPADPRADSDGDGVPNTVEEEYGTNKTSIDTDGDGLNDYDEIYKYPTNPLEPDSDFDGISDFDELLNFFTNPNNRDSDFDGLTDSEEIYAYGTNPTNWDTDGGGMSDRDEVTNGSDPNKEGDEYQFIWDIYYGSKPNDAYRSLQNFKMDIYQGMDLSLEAIKTDDIDKITIQFNGKELQTTKGYIKVKLLSPKETGFYEIKLIIDLKTGKRIEMTRYVEVKQRGKIISKVEGTFDSLLYSKIETFDDKPVEGAKIEIFEYDEILDELKLFEADVLGTSSEQVNFANPQYTAADGTYLLSLRPGNYLIKISKPEYGTKEVLYNTEENVVYSQDVYLKYSYDVIIWGLIFISTFLSTWLSIQIVGLLKHLYFEILKRFSKPKQAY